MTSFEKMSAKLSSLDANYGHSSHKAKVCRSILNALYKELQRYCYMTGRTFDQVRRFVCMVDLSRREYVVDVYPYVYAHCDAYTIIDEGFDRSFLKCFAHAKEQ